MARIVNVKWTWNCFGCGTSWTALHRDCSVAIVFLRTNEDGHRYEPVVNGASLPPVQTLQEAKDAVMERLRKEE